MSKKLDSFQMTFYTGPVAFVSLAPFAFASEWSIFAESLGSRPGATVGFLLGSCCVAVVYNVVLFQSVRTLSSVGTAILGNVRRRRAPPIEGEDRARANQRARRYGGASPPHPSRPRLAANKPKVRPLASQSTPKKPRVDFQILRL